MKKIQEYSLIAKRYKKNNLGYFIVFCKYEKTYAVVKTKNYNIIKKYENNKKK